LAAFRQRPSGVPVRRSRFCRRHRCGVPVNLPTLLKKTMPVVGETVSRGKALDFGGGATPLPPVCARFLLGGTCDKVLTAFGSQWSTLGGRIQVTLYRKYPMKQTAPRQYTVINHQNCFGSLARWTTRPKRAHASPVDIPATAKNNEKTPNINKP
jgi:hypothetical protein